MVMKIIHGMLGMFELYCWSAMNYLSLPTPSQHPSLSPPPPFYPRPRHHSATIRQVWKVKHFNLTDLAEQCKYFAMSRIEEDNVQTRIINVLLQFGAAWGE